MKSSDIRRFWDKVAIGAVDECWPWLAGCNGGGYGYFAINRKGFRAHRVAYCIYNNLKLSAIHGDIVRHTCDNPVCVNPVNHHLLGSVQDNINDAIERGHARGGSLPGEANGRAILTEEIVRCIRRRNAGGESQCSLAKTFGVATTTVYNIVHNKRWVNVT